MPSSSRFLVIDEALLWSANKLRVRVYTDVACHLTMRYQQIGIELHRRIKIRRGVPFERDPHLAFDNYLTLEQEEAGDTTTHTFYIIYPYPCKLFYWIFVATIGAAESPSQSPVFWGHYRGEYMCLKFSEPWGEEEEPPGPPEMCLIFTEYWSDQHMCLKFEEPWTS